MGNQGKLFVFEDEQKTALPQNSNPNKFFRSDFQ